MEAKPCRSPEAGPQKQNHRPLMGSVVYDRDQMILGYCLALAKEATQHPADIVQHASVAILIQEFSQHIHGR